MVPNIPERFQTVPNSPKWYQMVSNDSKYSHVVLHSYDWFQRAQYRPQIVPIDFKLSQFVWKVPNSSKWSLIVLNGLKLSNIAQNDPKVSQMF